MRRIYLSELRRVRVAAVTVCMTVYDCGGLELPVATYVCLCICVSLFVRLLLCTRRLCLRGCGCEGREHQCELPVARVLLPKDSREARNCVWIIECVRCGNPEASMARGLDAFWCFAAKL
ncbi:hypothetical protein E2C01_084743 [Portunus trituberculatus]|uniref:Uncharacterized protein n=1 Tax=Portunus trituberculatus TaxID=210409 RepID=A0A5B7J5M5_PORTR|nr:hypothetical protein [Portunus trituberculatus]